MKKSFRHYTLPPNHEGTFPSEIVYFDCETRYDPTLSDQVHDLRLGVATRQRYRGGEPFGAPSTLTFRRAEEFWDALDHWTRARRTVWVMAHNLDFDFGAVEGFGNVVNRRWGVRFWAFTPQCFLLRVQRERTALQFVDSFGFMRTALSRIGMEVGLEKLPMPDVSESDRVWEAYCERDVAVLKQAFESYMTYVKTNDLGHLALTGPGQALAAFRHRFMDCPINLHRVPGVMEAERSAYHGGRTEAFWIGQVPASPVYYLDVNSMYAQAMVSRSYPTKLGTSAFNPPLHQIEGGLRRFESLALCDLELSEPMVPVWREKLLFPVGQCRAMLAGPEFELCWERGAVKKVLWIAWYARGRPFESFVAHFSAERTKAKQQGLRSIVWFSKLLMNSLYGKWGQTNPTYRTEPAFPGEPEGITSVVSLATGRKETRLVLGGQVWVKDGEEPAYHASYPLAAWITAQARVTLWGLMEKAGREHVFYCDTDSLFVDQVGYDRLKGEIAPGVLGALGLRKEGTRLQVNGLKDYQFDDERRIKGVPSSARVNSVGEYAYTTFERTRTRLRQGRGDQVVQKGVTKKLSREYDKGHVLGSGRVIPFDLSGP